MGTTSGGSARKRKILALAAGAAVVGLGATYTLASWTDSEWVFGGGSGAAGGGVGTETFEVQQNRGSGWEQEEQNPGGALVFETDPLAMTPGDSIYAPVSLQTTSSSVAGTLTLQGAVRAVSGITPLGTQGPGDPLWEALRVTVYTHTGDTAASCTGAELADADTPWAVVTGLNGVGLASGATAEQSLDAESASTQNYCFQLTLPTGTPSTPDFMGQTVAPAWEFFAESD